MLSERRSPLAIASVPSRRSFSFCTQRVRMCSPQLLPMDVVRFVSSRRSRAWRFTWMRTWPSVTPRWLHLEVTPRRGEPERTLLGRASGSSQCLVLMRPSHASHPDACDLTSIGNGSPSEAELAAASGCSASSAVCAARASGEVHSVWQCSSVETIGPSSVPLNESRSARSSVSSVSSSRPAACASASVRPPELPWTRRSAVARLACSVLAWASPVRERGWSVDVTEDLSCLTAWWGRAQGEGSGEGSRRTEEWEECEEGSKEEGKGGQRVEHATRG